MAPSGCSQLGHLPSASFPESTGLAVDMFTIDGGIARVSKSEPESNRLEYQEGTGILLIEPGQDGDQPDDRRSSLPGAQTGVLTDRDSLAYMRVRSRASSLV
jgi:hypothetical protein